MELELPMVDRSVSLLENVEDLKQEPPLNGDLFMRGDGVPVPAAK